MATPDADRNTREHAPEATSRGILSDGALVAHYYTAEPSPDRWIAVGTIMFWPQPQRSGSPRWMLVGSGRSQREAVADLRVRLRQDEPPRWRIKCDPPDPKSHHPQFDDEHEAPGQFVVPWEVNPEEERFPLGTPSFDGAIL